jgi:hypothetical protein
MKCLTGPIFKLIEEELYKHPSFIKHVPVDERPEYIVNNVYVPGSWLFATDYTSFESLFTKKLMMKCEIQLYKYMTKRLPEGERWLHLVTRTMTGRNICVSKMFKMAIDATRMSGEMSTSLGNGFSNLMFASYVVKTVGGHNLRAVVEGDDGLFTYDGPAISDDLFRSLGLRIKLEQHSELATASFCGLVFDLEDRVNVRDPRKVLATFGWTGSKDVGSGRKKKMALLRAKSMSLQAQYPGCPILQALAQYGMRATRSYDITKVMDSRNTSWWVRQHLLEAQGKMRAGALEPRPVPFNTRLLVERLYDISIETQVRIERFFDSLDTVQPLKMELIEDIMLPEWKEHWEQFVVTKTAASGLTIPLGKDHPTLYDKLDESYRWPGDSIYLPSEKHPGIQHAPMNTR